MRRLILTWVCFFGVLNGLAKSNKELPEKEQVNYLIERLPKVIPLTVLANPSPVQTIKWSSDNIHIATYSVYGGVTNNLVRIWNSDTGALIAGIGSGKEIKSFAWAPDGKRIAITHHNNEAWICDLSKVFEIEEKMASLSSEELSFVGLFLGEKPLTELSKDQQKRLNKFSDVLKNALTEQLEFNKEGMQPSPLR